MQFLAKRSEKFGFHEIHQKVHFLLQNEKMAPKTINIPLARATFSQGARKERKSALFGEFHEKVNFSHF